MKNQTAINGRNVVVLERHGRSHGKAHIDEFVVTGRHDDWRIGTDITVSLRNEEIYGRLVTTYVNPDPPVTMIHIFYERDV